LRRRRASLTEIPDMTHAPSLCCAGDAALMPLAEATRRVLALPVPELGTERVPLAAADGRILAGDVAAPFDVPAVDNAAMDGWAIAAADLAADTETILPIGGRVAAGQTLPHPARRGEAVRIFTGAPLPEGLDTVVMQEECRIAGDRVVLPPGIRAGSHRRRRGEDVAAGRICIAAGRRLRPQEIGLAAALGLTHLEVRARPRVALFSSGDEVNEPGRPLAPGHLYDSNRPVLAALLTRLGCTVTDGGILPDAPWTMQTALSTAAQTHDVIIASGGMSVGEEDHMKAAVRSLGALDLWRVAIKPGKPVAFGSVCGRPFIGLPGNPVAVMVTFLRLARPYLLHAMGASDLLTPSYTLPAAFDHRKPAGRRDFLRGRLIDRADGSRAVAKFRHEGSHVISSMVEADGLIELPEDVTDLRQGDVVAFLPFEGLL
jgi:molybdopterin molybdotransferase